MIRSMTGIGVASGTVGSSELRVEIRSVNHRFLQLKTRLPLEYSALEGDVEALVKKRLDRGAVTVNAAQPRTARNEGVRIDAALAASWREKLSAVARELGVEDDMTLSRLISLPGVLGSGEDEADDEARGKALLAIVKKALDDLVKMREVEGAALDKDLRKNAKAASKITASIAKRMPKVVREHHAATRKRLDELLGGVRTIAENDLAREVALLAERLDVAEELSRFASHIEQLEATLAAGGAVGRKLEFLMQELQREANTIGSKCNDAQVAISVVDLKTLVERLREQVQNVE